MIVARTIAKTRSALAGLPRPLGFVPTMGAFHEGHLTLMRAARERCATVVASIFVNPTQFGPEEGYAQYPRDEAGDRALAKKEGVDLVFCPKADEMYRDGAATTVIVTGPLTEAYEAAERRGHFDGVATVVTKLFAIVQPDVVFFGRKDAQQLAVVRRLVLDLDLPAEVVGLDTVREPDGLALSSRNACLSEAQRAKAADLYRALVAGRAVTGDGRRVIVNEVTSKLVLGFPPYLQEVPFDAPSGPQFSVDYVDVVDPETFERVDEPTPGSLIIAAARLGETRLIDNLPIGEASEVDDQEAATEAARTSGKKG